MKTNELTGAALDWAVAKCEGFVKIAIWPDHIGVCRKHSFENQFRWAPSTDWAQGGPIIDRMQLNRLTTNVGGGYTASVKVTLINTDDDAYMVWTHGSGPTPLIAAMRCYVASKLGDEIEIPRELT